MISVALAIAALAIVAYALIQRNRPLGGENPTSPDTEWSVLATYASGFEADLVIERLRAADIPALRDSNDTVGIFGPGFQGASAKGIKVLVPTEALEDARELVEPSDDLE